MRNQAAFFSKPFAWQELPGMSAAILACLFYLAPLPSRADAASVSAHCSDLNRPSVDCACVARRVDRMREALPDDVDSNLLDEAYRSMTGKDSRYEASLEAALQDPRRMLELESALDEFGGLSANIEDYEAGCVIGGGGLAPLPPLTSEPAVEGYIGNCIASTGDERYCRCAAARARDRVDRSGFEAYFRSFADFSDKTALSLEEMAAARAQAMDMDIGDYQELRNRARHAIDSHAEKDAAYCAALLWPEDVAGDDPGTVAGRYHASGSSSDRTAAPTASDPAPASGAAEAVAGAGSAAGDSSYPRARQVVEQSCTADGLGAQACRCLLEAVEREVFPAVDSEKVALAYALLAFGSGTNPMESMSVLSSLSPQEQMAAGMLMAQKDPMAGCY